MSRPDRAPAGDDGRLGVVVVNYGSAHLVAENLGRVELTGVPTHVVLVDNHTTDIEADAVRSLAAEHGWQALLLPDNRGFGGGVNAGVAAAREAGCTVFLLLNPDATAAPAVLEEIRQECLRRPAALVSPRVLRPDGSTWFDGALLDLSDGTTRGGGAAALRHPPAGTQPWITGACLGVHGQLWDRLGGFDEEYFLYWEDVDLSHRCLEAGGELVLREDLIAHHDVGGTQSAGGGRAKSALYYRYNCRNRLVFAARHLSRRRMLAWLAHTPAGTRDILLRGGRRQLLRQPGLAWSAVRGSAEGTAHVLRALIRGRRPRGNGVLVVHPGAELYGSDRMLAESVAGLVGRGDRVTVALPGPGPLVDVLEALGAEVVSCPMPVLRKSALSPRGAAAFLRDLACGAAPAMRLLRRRGAAGVYVSTQIIPLWAPLARLSGRRVTTHVHEAEGAAPRLLRLLLALPVVLADRIVLNSRYSRDVLLDPLPSALAQHTERRSTVVYNGVAGPPTVIPARPELTGRVQLLYVGRLSPRKGPHVALAALAELRARGIDAELTLAGAVFPGYEWYEAELRATATSLGVDDAVRLAGFLPDVTDALAASDVVLVPSLQDEPFGNTAVEAVLAARPVVVSATSGLREAVHGFGSAQAVQPGEPVALADAVERVADGWTTYARAALADAAEARRRYDVGRYRCEIAAIMADREMT